MDARTTRLLEQASTNGWPMPAGDPPGDSAIVAWLGQPGPRDPSGVGRYLAAVWRERADLREAFPGVPFDRTQRDAYLEWARSFAVIETGADPRLIPEAPSNPASFRAGSSQAQRPDGITVVGYLRAQLGLGAAARRMVSLLQNAEISVQAIPYDHTDSPLTVEWPDVALENIIVNQITVLCVNAPELPRLTRALGPRHLAETYRIGLWFWELEVLPEPAVDMVEACGLVDEIWVTSDFVARAFRQRVSELRLNVPVEVLPLGLDVPAPSGAIGRSRLRIPEGFVIGASFDYASTVERKNPVGMIDAFQRAFPDPFELGPDVGPWLVIKTHGSPEFDRDRAMVKEAVAARPDIVIVDANFTEAEQHAFYRSINVYISLHRSEGYGLGPLEAMANGVPTVATAYSGNLSFMTAQNSWLVPAGRTTVPPGCGHYPAGSTWADPDVTSAAFMLREITTGYDTDRVRQRAAFGKAETAGLVSGDSGARWVRDRLHSIRSRPNWRDRKPALG